tara:strand:+ start:814 stop:1011 length:198 start_codon:yes stop_codon:yes gene_type:complete
MRENNFRCSKCNDKDSGYTDDTPLKDRDRAVFLHPNRQTDLGARYFCVDCWEEYPVTLRNELKAY